MIPAPTKQSEKNDTTSKSHVSDATVSDSIVPTILEPSSDITDIKGFMSRLESKLDNYIARLTVLEFKLEDHSNLHQTPDP